MKQVKWVSPVVSLTLALSLAGFSAAPVAAQSGGQERPELPDELIYVTDRFAIHYTERGEHRIDPADSDHSGYPDYVEEVAVALEYTWDVEIHQMGWSPPPRDQGEGGDTRYDVYLENIMPNDIAGYAQSEGGYVGDNPETPERERRAAYSFLSLDNDFAEVVNSDVLPLNLLKATVAHEFNHVIQAGYDDFDPQTWLYEATATWMEMEVYPDISDSWAYLPDVLAAPDVCRTARSGWYGSWLFVELLSEKYGRDLIRSVWDHNRQLDGYSAIDKALEPHGSSLIFESREFAAANLLRAYRNGRQFPTVQVEGSVEQGTYNPDSGVQSLGADYIEISGGGMARVAFNPASDSLSGELIAVRGGDADRFDLSLPAVVDLSAYDASYVVVHNDEQAVNEEVCDYLDYNIDVSASDGPPSSAALTVSAENFSAPTAGSGGSVSASDGGLANAGSGAYHPPYSGGSGDNSSVFTNEQDIDVDFNTLTPERPPVGYELDYAYIRSAADFGSSANYYVPNGDISANFDYLSGEGNWLSLTESPSPYATLQDWLDAVGYAPEGDIRVVDGIEVLVEDLSLGGETAISATLIVNDLFIVVDGDHSEDDVVAMVEAVIAVAQPPQLAGGTQFPSPDIDLSAVTPEAPSGATSFDPDNPMAFLGFGLCGLAACLLIVGGGILAAIFFRRRS